MGGGKGPTWGWHCAMADCGAGPASPKTVNVKKYQINASGDLQDAVNYLLQRVPPQPVKITSQNINNIYSTQSPCSAHLSVDLDFSSAIEGIRSSSLTTANISAQDFPVFTTDSQSTWLPNSPSSLPAPSAHQSQSPVENQQDFVLFDNPQPRQARHNRSSDPLSSQRRHSYHNRRDKLVSAAVQNQRVAQILQAIGHPSSSVNANRFATQFYASSAPSSSVSLNQQQRTRSARPPVPLFHQSANMMNAAGLSTQQSQSPHASKTIHLHATADVDLDEFTAFEGGASAFSSPAVPSAMDFNGSMSSSTSTMGTVSPHDLLVHEPFMSAPNSAALTALTSPSIYNESPDFDGYDVSPNFGSTDFDGSGDPWYPLFPQDSTNQSSEVVDAEGSPTTKSEDVDSVGKASGTSSRKNASQSPTSGGRHSSVAGVNSRKRDKPLPPIVVDDPHDTVAMKRARNTLAARKSRERKAQRFDELEDRIAKLEAERDHWKQIALSQSGSQ
ncbi:General control protein [Conoideocrella luteorostrata]|uniref:Cross-pathway control protein 1 n=1 Tax=Conoideocrella luteorostrata TaxID=1105319 RepID=A0AAJ0D183_9HYPO|nr:General control protein [Conoideocrella luteorostrata]